MDDLTYWFEEGVKYTHDNETKFPIVMAHCSYKKYTSIYGFLVTDGYKFVDSYDTKEEIEESLEKWVAEHPKGHVYKNF